MRPILGGQGTGLDLELLQRIRKWERQEGVVSASPYMAGLLAGLPPDQAAARRQNDSPPDLARARALWRWAAEHAVDLGAVAVQYQLRNAHITTTLVGPRSADEVEANLRHATTRLPDGIWGELETFLAALGPYAPGGEAQ